MAVERGVVEASIAECYTGVFLGILIVRVAQEDDLFQQPMFHQFRIEIGRIAAHVSNQIQHPRFNPHIPASQQSLDITIGVDSIDGLICVFG